MAFGIQCAMRVCGIYKIANVVNGKFYVGSSVNVEGRIFKHLSKLRAGTHKNAHLQSAFAKYGEAAFDFHLLESCERNSLLGREQHYIDTLNPSYNICEVAGNTAGYKHTLQGKAKMSAANKGNQRALGNRHTEETRRKIAQANTGRKWSDAEKARIAETSKGNKSNTGRTLPPEQRANVSAGLLKAWVGADAARRAAAERLRAQWADPAWKALQAQRIRDGKAAKLAGAGDAAKA